MLRKNTKVLIGFSSLFFCVSAGIFATFLVVVESQKDAYITETIAHTEATARQESLIALGRTLDATKDARDSLKARILKEEEVIDLLSLIETIGREQGVQLTTNALTVQPIDDTFEALVIQVSVEGLYDSVRHVLKLFEYLPYQASVEKVQLSKGSASSGDVWQGAFEIRVIKYTKL